MVFVASTEFVDAADAQADALGADPARVFVPHPIQDRTDDELRALADAALDEIVAGAHRARRWSDSVPCCFCTRSTRSRARTKTSSRASFRDGWMPTLGGHRRRPAALLPPPRARHRPGVQPRHDHGRAATAPRGSTWSAGCSEAICGRWPATSTSCGRMSRARCCPRPVVTAPGRRPRAVPTDGGEHDLTLFMEDTAWPHAGRLDEYLEAARTTTRRAWPRGATADVRSSSCRPCSPPRGARGRWREVVLWQKVTQLGAHRSAHDRGARGTPRAGTWMHDALRVRDDWESRLLRTVAWSPLF